MRVPLDPALATQAANDRRALRLTAAENGSLSYAEKGTTDEASVRRRDINKLREAGLAIRMFY